MITCIAKKEKLWSILSRQASNLKMLGNLDDVKREKFDDDSMEHLMYIMTMSIKSSILS